MNYSMEERGKAPTKSEAASAASAAAVAPGADRFLSGDPSLFGVGSKNAAFLIGRSIKVATRKAGSPTSTSSPWQPLTWRRGTAESAFRVAGGQRGRQRSSRSSCSF